MTTGQTHEGYQEVHKGAIVYDAVCPVGQNEEMLDDMIRGGVTVAALTIGGSDDCAETMRSIGMWYARLGRRADDLLLVTRVEDMERAKREGKLGLIFHFQGTTPIGRDLGMVEVYYRLGVRIIQLTYNVKDFVGDGCEEPGDGGLSDFGKRLIREMNRAGMLVDLSHTGHRTTMEAMEASDAPCVFSHSNCHSVYRSNRNIRDEQIRAVAAGGGVAGVTAFPGVVSGTRPAPTRDELLAHFDYYANLVGIDHIGFGSDYYYGQDPYSSLEEAHQMYQERIDSGSWKPETYRPPPYIHPEGIETPDKLPNLTRMLMEHEYSRDDVHKVLGGNFMRVYRQVWK